MTVSVLYTQIGKIHFSDSLLLFHCLLSFFLALLRLFIAATQLFHIIQYSCSINECVASNQMEEDWESLARMSYQNPRRTKIQSGVQLTRESCGQLLNSRSNLRSPFRLLQAIFHITFSVPERLCRVPFRDNSFLMRWRFSKTGAKWIPFDWSVFLLIFGVDCFCFRH